jgi:lambda family phage tail tape measure protein
MFINRCRKIIKDYIAGTKELVDATRKSHEESRSWSTGWKQAMNEYVQNVSNGAAKAKDLFAKATKGMEDLIVNFAKTGKFEWKNFVNMMLEELLRAQIQMLFADKRLLQELFWQNRCLIRIQTVLNRAYT